MMARKGPLLCLLLLCVLPGTLQAEMFSSILFPRVDCEVKAPKAGLFQAATAEGNLVKAGDTVAWLQPQPNSLPELRRAVDKAEIGRDRAQLALDEYEKVTYGKELAEARMQSLNSELAARKASRDSTLEKGLAGIGASTDQKAGDKDLDCQARQITLERDRAQLQEKSRPLTEQAAWKRLKLALREAQNAFEDAREDLDPRAVTAVESGEVVRLLTRESETVAPGAGLLRIADASVLLAEFSLPASAAQALRAGTANGAQISARSGGVEVKASLASLTTTPDAVTRKVRAVLQVDNTERRLAPGDELEIELGTAAGR